MSDSNHLDLEQNELFIEPIRRRAFELASPCLRKFLSTTQNEALPKLQSLHRISKVDFQPMGISIRTKPLIIGPSGAGKTAVIRIFAQKLEKELLCINAGSWIVYGAKNDNYSVRIIQQFVSNQWEKGGVIFIDEIDKCVPHDRAGGMSDWAHGVFSELLAILDSDNRLLTMGWNKQTLKAFRAGGYFIVGAGAWQHVGNNFSKAKVGFGMEQKVSGNYAAEFKKGFGIPDEIAERFSQDIVFIDYPTEDDFTNAIKGIHSQLCIAIPPNPQLEQLAKSAVDAKRGVRWLENYIVSLLQDHPVILERYTSEPEYMEKNPGNSCVNFAEMLGNFNKMLFDLSEVASNTALHLRRKYPEIFTMEISKMLFGVEQSLSDSQSGMRGLAHALAYWSRELSSSLQISSVPESIKTSTENRWEKYLNLTLKTSSDLLEHQLHDLEQVDLVEVIGKLHNFTVRVEHNYRILQGQELPKSI